MTDAIHFVDANGLNFAYLENGSGPLVLMLHGFPDTAHSWDDLRPRIAAKGYRAVSPFMRGYHPSAIPDRDTDQETLARDPLALIEALGARDAIIIGHDWGALAGYAATNWEDRAKHLFSRRARYQKVVRILKDAFPLRAELKNLAQPDTLICRCEDVPQVRLREHGSWRAAKLHVRCGMGPCQGRVCAPAAEFLFGWEIDSARPPVFPVHCSSLAAIPSHSAARH